MDQKYIKKKIQKVLITKFEPASCWQIKLDGDLTKVFAAESILTDIIPLPSQGLGMSWGPKHERNIMKPSHLG